MNPLLDGWLVLSQEKWPIFVILICMSWGLIIIITSLRCLDLELNISEYISLAIAGWVLPVFLVSVLIFALGGILNVRINTQVAIALLVLNISLLIWANGRKEKGNSHSFALTLLALLCIFLLSSFLRLVFIARAPLPLYIDSAEHYQIIQNLIKDFKETDAIHHFVWPVPVYYHLGFHLITAILTATFQLDIARTILVLGQLIAASTSIPLFFLIRHETGSDTAGLIAILLGSFGWYMPSFTANWGKYPALLSLLTIQFSLSMVYLFGKEKKPHRPFASIGIILISIGTSFLVHTRSIILMGIAITAWTLSGWWKLQTLKWRNLFFGFIASGLIFEAVLIGKNIILNPLFDPYLGSAIWVTGFVGIFAFFAFKKYPQFSFACLASIFFLLLGLLTPIPNNTDLTLLDRPLVEMVLFIPLSLLSGLGWAALNDFAYIKSNWLRWISTILIIGAIVFHALMNYSFYPSNCCTIVGRDDLVALDWLNNHTRTADLIAISSAELKITASSQNPQIAGSDAGVWIMPLTDRHTLLLPHITDFNSPDTLKFVCKEGISDIYVGSMAQSFNRKSIEEKPGWYKNILFLPEAQIYQVTGCQ